jgi:hypothetical protein
VAEAEWVVGAAPAERDDSDARLRLRPTSSHTRRRNRRLAACVGGFALVGASATMAVAAQTALPGDSLYPIKRGLEGAHAELTFDRADRGRVVLGNASRRLDEAQDLSRLHADPAHVSEALDAFTQQAIDGSDLLVSDYEATGDRSSITSVRTFTVASMDRLNLLQSQVPPQSLGSLLRAARTLDQVQESSVHACAVCRGPVIGAVPTVLTHSMQATLDAWQVAVPKPHHAHQPLQPGADGGPVLPHLHGQLPPASVTDPDSSDAAPPAPPSADDVQHTVQHLTDGLTEGQQNDVASTVSDTATNLLDAVGEVGNQVAGTLDGTIGDVTSLVPGNVISP